MSAARKLIEEIERALHCRLLVMFYNTEEAAFATQLAGDVMPCLRRALSRLSPPDGGLAPAPLALLLQTRGGVLDSPWPIVSGIRAVTRDQGRDFWVIVNDKAHSAGTLIAISADKIIMSHFGSLSPVDAQINLNTGPNTRVGAGVEDIQGYYDLINSLFKNDEAARAQAFSHLVQRIPAEMLGQVQRIHEYTRLVIRKMLALRKDQVESETADSIVRALTKDFYSHNYHISPPECLKLALPVETLSADQQLIIDELYKYYAAQMEIGKDLTLRIPTGEAQASVIKSRAFIETSDTCFVFQSEVVVNRDKTAQVNDLGWKEIEI